MVNKLAIRLLDGVFPSSCTLCGLRSHRELPLCAACEAELPANRHACSRCAIPLPPDLGSDGGQVCGRCLSYPPAFDRVVAPWLYGEFLAHLIHRWKYQRETHLTALLASLWRQHAHIHPVIDLLVPVPLHWRRRWYRGFNQSGLLAAQLRATCPELRASTLDHRRVKRCRSTAPQSGMIAAERAHNLTGAFTVSGPCDNLRIALVDDVLTTGETAAAVATVMKKAGASHIEVWCLARTPAPGTRSGPLPE